MLKNANSHVQILEHNFLYNPAIVMDTTEA